MSISRHRLFLSATLLELAVVIILLAHAEGVASRSATSLIPAKRSIAERLGLTDLAIWTEARYTRHPSQADLFSPFQDYPASLEHFPAGSIVGVPDMASFRAATGR